MGTPTRTFYRNHPFYHIWGAMIQRCTNENVPGYKHYGGRGITFYEPWRDYRTFETWILENLGPKPEGMSLDRRDNDGNYEPGNLRWGTKQDQSVNRRIATGLPRDVKRNRGGTFLVKIYVGNFLTVEQAEIAAIKARHALDIAA